MACLQCENSKTIKAHLMPKAFVMETKPTRSEHHILSLLGKENFKTNVTGLYDPEILCSSCDGILGEWENYTYQTLTKVKKLHLTPRTIQSIQDIDCNKLIRFAAGIAWKYAKSNKYSGQLKLGPYAKLLGQIAFSKEDIPTSVNLTIVKLAFPHGHFPFYREPLLDRAVETNYVRFTVSGTIFFLKVDQRTPEISMPAASWLRNNQTLTYTVVDARNYEEGIGVFELSSNPKIRNYFSKMP